MIKQEISEAHNPREYIRKIRELKREYIEKWGSMPDLHMSNDVKDINVITFGILRGSLPIGKKEKLCAFPNCTERTNSSSERVNHWRKEHGTGTCPEHNPFSEIFEIFGVDVVTETKKDNSYGYITTPLVKCPINGCTFSAHQAANMREHLRTVHEQMYLEALELSALHRYLWLIVNSGNDITIDNILYKGEAIQCKFCGWCTTCESGATRHPAIGHREEKRKDIQFMQSVTLDYNMYNRDGTSLTPFVGMKFEVSKNYLITSTAQPRNPNKRSLNKHSEERHNNHIMRTEFKLKSIISCKHPKTDKHNKNRQTQIMRKMMKQHKIGKVRMKKTG